VKDLYLLAAIPRPTDIDHHDSALAVIGGHHEMICRLGCMVRMVCSPGHPRLIGCCPPSQPEGGAMRGPGAV